ncbi:glutaredoxin [Candidatus Woesearchaeota archaeon]|nr:glutaredoxin [Candidatus Woesearchaeota archaeon]
MIKLYRFTHCPFCDTVQDFMDEQNIAYEIVLVHRENKPKEVTSTGGTVPVIEDNGKLISDSKKIIAYLRNTHLAKQT